MYFVKIINSFRKRNIFVVFLFLFSVTTTYAYTYPGSPTGYVNDFANILTTETRQNLENKLSLFNASTTNEISVVTISSLDGDTVENFAVKLFEDWKIGKEKQDNGILFLIAYNDHKMRIEVGYGLEGALPDAKASRILSQVVTPLFKENKYNEGVSLAVDEIINATKDENYVVSSVNSSNGFSFDSWIFIIVFGSQIFLFLVSILARSKSWWAGGIVGGVIGLLITFFLSWSFVFGGIVTFFFLFFGLLFDYIVSNTYKSSVASGNKIPWWIGGGGRGGGFSSSSGGFGGFGGGSSGGGGASGSW